MTTVVIGMDDGTTHVLVPGYWADARVEKLLARLKTALAGSPPVTRDTLRAAADVALDELRTYDADQRKEEDAKAKSASDSFSYFFYGIAAVIALIFVGVIRKNARVPSTRSSSSLMQKLSLSGVATVICV